MAKPVKTLVAAAALCLIGAFATSAHADETCNSPYTSRLIKGQVFLWKQNQSWEDLWDVTGEITPA